MGVVEISTIWVKMRYAARASQSVFVVLLNLRSCGLFVIIKT